MRFFSANGLTPAPTGPTEVAQPGLPARAERRRPRGLPTWAAALLLAVVCMVVYNANLRTIGAGDTLPARYLPLIVWHHGTLDFDDDGDARLVAHGHPLHKIAPQSATPGSEDYVTSFTPRAFWIVPSRDGGRASLYPVVAPLLVAPLYLPAHLYLKSHGYQQPYVDRVAELMEKLSASLLATIAAVLMFVLLRRERIPWALPLAAAFAFGTNTWMISSQALWQHGSGELLITLGLVLAVERGSPRRLVGLGFVCVLIAANRPPDALIAAALLLFAVWRERRDLKWLAAGAALPLLALLAFNLVFIGNLIGGYAGRPGAKHFVHLELLGPAGLLLSPGRGLLIFAPFLAFVVVGLRARLRDPATRRLAIALSGAVVLQLVIYSQTDWRAGNSWGPRWLADLLPILVWMLAPAPALLRPAWRRVLVAAIVASVAVQAVGAFWYTGVSDERIFGGPDPASTRAAWKPANAPFVVEARHAPATAELTCGAHGFFEKIGSSILHDDGSVSVLANGAPLEGWALTCGRTPAQVLAIVDGVVVGATTTFTPRPDVNRAMGASSPTGFHLDANTHGLAAGRHALQLAVRIQPRSDLRVIREEQVDVTPPPAPGSPADLRALAARASAHLQGDQSPEGYWLTTFTGSTAYASPAQELNTYTTSVLVDLLRPVAGANGLEPSLARARRHLAAQIEPTGLVRYHGLPDAPGIGTLGCVITPDADDTALAWRIAGPGASDPRFRPMLRVLREYRAANGLIKTWLAPQARYQCIDPGRNPDPADRVNQMHVYLMLRALDPAAAPALCRAIQRSARAGTDLVYYDKTALMPYLRSAELGRRGCPLPLPSARLARPAAGQEAWSDVVRRLVATMAARPSAAARREAAALLSRLGRNDFLALRQEPPLLYHNDLTASVSRFYWSEDAGYALWLRLYAATTATTR